MPRFDINSVFRQFDYIDGKLNESPSKLESTWGEASKYGWYPSPTMPGKLSLSILENQETIDSKILQKFKKAYTETKHYILDFSAERKNILNVAFCLHEEGNFIACIPLFMSQSDGIYNDTVGQSVFSRKQQKIRKFVESQFHSKQFGKAFFNSFSATTQFKAQSSSFDPNMKSRAPNRNGILHGDINHLDYGTYVNSCKTINLLACVTWFSSEVSKA